MGNDHGLTGGHKAWWWPSRSRPSPARSEPIRHLCHETATAAGSRFGPRTRNQAFRVRGHPEEKRSSGRRHAADPHLPGLERQRQRHPRGCARFALNWLELEGPLQDEWPPASPRPWPGTCRKLEGGVKLVPEDAALDARKLLLDFMKGMYRRPVDDAEAEAYLAIFERSQALGWISLTRSSPPVQRFFVRPIFCISTPSWPAWPTAARLAAFVFVEQPARRGGRADQGLPKRLWRQVERMLDDPRAARFVDSFLDYWLDLRRTSTHRTQSYTRTITSTMS